MVAITAAWSSWIASRPAMPWLMRDIAALVLHRRLGELEVDLSDVRVEDDQPPQPHGRRFRDAQQLRHLARHVLVHVRLAREAPTLRELRRTQLAVIRSLGVLPSRDDPNLALAAGPPPAARRVDGEADPVRRAEQRGAGRHSRGALKRQVGDLELALDHWPARARSARYVEIHRIAYSSCPRRRSPASTAR